MLFVLRRIIAIMGDSYECVKENESVEALHEQAKTIVDMELLYPKGFPFFGPHKYGRYMHILTEKGNGHGSDYGGRKPWEGITGPSSHLSCAILANTSFTSCCIVCRTRETGDQPADDKN